MRIALLATVLVLLAPAPASGAPRWISKDLPLSPALTHRMAIVPLAPPSPEHPLGTVAIVGPDAVYAWDLEAKRFLTGRSLGATTGQDAAVVAVRADDEIFVLSGNSSETAGPSEIVLITLGLDLAVRSRDVIGRGLTPSLAVSDRWIVAGASEKRLAFHAVVLDRKTRAVVAARVFQGAVRGIAIHAERAVFSFSGASEALLVSTELPSLHTVKTSTERAVVMDDGCGPLISAWGHAVGMCEPMRIRFRR